jgi:hypothetical protein
VDRSVAASLSSAHALEQSYQLPLLLFGEAADGVVVGVAHFLLEISENLEAALGDVAEDLAPVGRRSIASGEACLLQLVQQAGDSRRGVDHSVANHQRRQAFTAGAAKDAEYVVLLHGDAGSGDDLREVSFDERGGSENAHRDFGFHRMEGPALSDLRLQATVIVFFM